jgi:hypothetical protein
MSASNLVRFGGLAAMVGGALFVVAELLGLPTLNEEAYSETVTTTSYAIQQLLFLLGVVFVLLGLVGLYVRQSEAAGTLGLVGFLVAFAGTVLIAGFLWAGAFIAPALVDTLPPYTRRRPSPGDPAVDHRLRPRADLVRGGYATGARLPPRGRDTPHRRRGGHRSSAALHHPRVGRGRSLAGLRPVCGKGAPAEQPARVS